MPIISFGQTFNCKYFTANHGLPSSYVNTSFQDANGYLWVGTYGGLSRFDGKSFKNFTVNDGLGSNQITAIIQDEKKNLWLGTFFGVTIYDGLKFKNITEIDGTTIERTRTLCNDSEGNIWGGCMNGIWKFDKKTEKFKIFKKLNDSTNFKSIRSIIEYKKGQMLFGSGFFCYLFDGKKITQINDYKGNPTSNTSFLKYKNRLLVGTYEQGWKEFDGKVLKPYINFPELEKHIVFKQIEDKKGRLWLATDSGIYIFENEVLIKHLTKPEFLTDDLCLDIMEDSEGNMWISTPEGIVQCKSSFIDKFDRNNGLLNDEIYGLFFDKYENKMFFAGAGKTVSSFKNEKFSYQFDEIQTNAIVDFVNKDLDGNYWVGIAYQGLYKIENGKIYKQPLHRKECNAFIQNPINKKIWVGGRSELFEFDGKNWKIYGSDVFKGDDILDFYIDNQQRLWMGCKGLWMFDGKKFYDFSKESDTKNVLIQSIKVDNQGFMWLGGIGNGIRKIAINPDNTIKLVEKITQKEGLTNENIMDLQFDNEGQLWVSSFSGVMRIDIRKPKVNGQYPKRVFELNDGLIDNTWRIVPMEKDAEGNIWVGTSKGAMRFRIKDMYRNNNAPKVHITNLQLFQEPIEWSKENADLQPFTQIPNHLKLENHQNYPTFYFSGISLSNPENIYYSYKLENLNDNWSPLTQQNNISYSKLSPGFYTFSVKAMNSDGIWSPPTNYSFEIKPAFWQTWWFRIFITMLAIAAIYVFLKNREKRINEKNQYELQMTELKLKALQSQMNPHFLFNSLNSVQNYILTNRGIEGAKYLSKFSKLVRKIMENSNHQFLRFEEIIETLKMYVEIESFRFNHEFHYEFDIEEDDALLETPLPPMLLQPFVENSIWHGLMPKEGNKQLIIKAFRKGNYIFCSIEDNGVGRKNNQTRREGHISRGQEMTKGIFDSLQQNDNNAKLEIIDLFDTENKPVGTRVEMLIPIN